MIVEDLGALEGELMIFGGPYSNLQALLALKAQAAHLGLTARQVICTGDVVAYGADAAGCVAAMQAWGVPTVAGNCEKQLAAGAMTCGCGFVAGSTCDRLSAGWFTHADASCDAAARHWMGRCPDVILFTHAGRRCAVVHGGVTDVARFLWPVTPEAGFLEEIAALEAQAGPVDRIFAGHCGLPFSKTIARVAWINTGVIGMPPNDGAPDTRFGRVRPDGKVEIQPLTYDAAGAAAAMRRAGLTQGYDSALLTGRWPSQDVLPEALRWPEAPL